MEERYRDLIDALYGDREKVEVFISLMQVIELFQTVFLRIIIPLWEVGF